MPITTETDRVASKNEPDGSDVFLYAYHYSIKSDSTTLKWKLTDFVKDCAFDWIAGFIKNSFAVTDLDKNGEAEVWLMYRIVCRSDVSPADMKIIMYENGKKYAVRGTTKVQFAEKEYTGGEYSFDEAFKKAPEAFRQYAEKLWKKNMLETWN
jgi:hypothetical protein